jgi:hypothetical protein
VPAAPFETQTASGPTATSTASLPIGIVCRLASRPNSGSTDVSVFPTAPASQIVTPSDARRRAPERAGYAPARVGLSRSSIATSSSLPALVTHARCWANAMSVGSAPTSTWST